MSGFKNPKMSNMRRISDLLIQFWVFVTVPKSFDNSSNVSENVHEKCEETFRHLYNSLNISENVKQIVLNDIGRYWMILDGAVRCVKGQCGKVLHGAAKLLDL